MKIKEVLTMASRVCHEGAEICRRYLARLSARGVDWGSMPIVVYRIRETLSNYAREYKYLNDIVLDNATTEAFNDYRAVFVEQMTRELAYIYAVLAELILIQNLPSACAFVTDMLKIQDDIYELKKTLMLNGIENERKDDQ